MIVLRGALREALAEGVIDRDPTALVALPEYHPPTKRAIACCASGSGTWVGLIESG